ncbi:MAG: MFS transporter, partial [Promethearchaeota archaeon]
MAKENGYFEESIPKASKIWYALANGANGILSGLGLGQVMVFYTDIMHLDPNLQGLAWLIFAGWNAINDPILGILEDRSKNKLGRRIPFLRYGAPIYAFLFIFVWFPFAPPGNQPLLFLNLLIILFLFDTIYSLIGLVTYSLPAEMAITAKERGSIIMYSSFIGFPTQLIGFVLPIAFLQTMTLENVFQWQFMMIIFGVICGLTIFFSSFFIKENKWAQKEETLGFVESVVETFKNKQFLILEVMIFATLINQTILLSGVVFLFKYSYRASSLLDYMYLFPAIIS